MCSGEDWWVKEHWHLNTNKKPTLPLHLITNNLSGLRPDTNNELSGFIPENAGDFEQLVNIKHGTLLPHFLKLIQQKDPQRVVFLTVPAGLPGVNH